MLTSQRLYFQVNKIIKSARLDSDEFSVCMGNLFLRDSPDIIMILGWNFWKYIIIVILKARHLCEYRFCNLTAFILKRTVSRDWSAQKWILFLYPTFRCPKNESLFLVFRSMSKYDLFNYCFLESTIINFFLFHHPFLSEYS